MPMYSSPTCFDIAPPMCQRVCMMKGQRRNCVVGPMLIANSGPTCFDVGPPMYQRVCMMKGQRKNCVVGPMLIAYSGPMLVQQGDHIGPTLSQHVCVMKARWANYRWPNVILQQWPNISCTVGPTMILLHIAIWGYLRYRSIMKRSFFWYHDFWLCDLDLELWPSFEKL
jgi:hypothetical protein